MNEEDLQITLQFHKDSFLTRSPVLSFCYGNRRVQWWVKVTSKKGDGGIRYGTTKRNSIMEMKNP